MELESFFFESDDPEDESEDEPESDFEDELSDDEPSDAAPAAPDFFLP